MRIAIYDIAADSGGALTVLSEYYRRAKADEGNEYMFVLGLADFEECERVSVKRFPKAKKNWFGRIKFELFEAKKIVEGFKPDKVISLQNICVPFLNCPQIVYMHNLLPKEICDLRFRLWSNPKLWVYQNLIGRLIMRSLKEADGIVVQTNWLKRRLIERLGLDAGRIVVERPEVWSLSAPIKKIEHDNCVFVYPAACEEFKNHNVIVEAVNMLVEEGISDGYEVVFTLCGTENERSKQMLKEAIDNNLPIKFIGWVDKEEMGNLYSASDVVLFPSKLESWGLPLSEAAANNLSVFAADLDYAHETLGDYQKACFFSPDNKNDLAGLMRSFIERNVKSALRLSDGDL